MDISSMITQSADWMFLLATEAFVLRCFFRATSSIWPSRIPHYLQAQTDGSVMKLCIFFQLMSLPCLSGSASYSRWLCLSPSMPACLPACLHYLSICLSVCPSVCLSVSVCLSFLCLCVSPSVGLSVCLSVYLFVYVFLCLYMNGTHKKL